MPDPAIPADRLTRFTGRGVIYAQHRPSYPAAAIDAILDGLPRAASIAAADIGAGTGISARLLADRGCAVTAIEPNEDMAAAAEPHPRVRWSAGTGEQTGLPDDSTELVLCAQSFHWMNPGPTLAEFARILRHPGRVAIMWNAVDEVRPVGVAYRDLIKRHATNTITSPGRTGAHERALDQLEAAPDLEHERRLTFTFQQELTLDAFIGRAASSSYCPRSGYAFETMSADLAGVFDAHAEPRTAPQANRRITLPYTTHLFVAERRPR